MDIFEKIGLNCFSLIICAVMYHTNLKISEKNMPQNRFFRLLIQYTMVILALEVFALLVDKKQGELFYVLNILTNTIFFVIGPIPPLLWALYASYQLFHDMHRLRVETILLGIPIIVSALMSLLSPFMGLVFGIDNNNIYQRGPFFMVYASAAFLPIIYSAILYIVFRKKIPKKIFIPMLLFIIPPVVGAIVQTLFYGITVLWSSVTLAIFIVHNSVQSQKLNLDYLTGIYNRRQMDNYLDDRILSARKGKGFSCIILDIDNFKSINDTYGHIAGDEVLTDAAQILKSCIRNDDFLARYGGDEFIIVLDIGDQQTLEMTISRIQAKVAEYNQNSSKPFELSFSTGCKMYDFKSGMIKEEFISDIDALMYRDKEIKTEPKIGERLQNIKTRPQY